MADDVPEVGHEGEDRCSPDELPVRCLGAMHQGWLRDGVGGAPSVYTRRFRPYRIFGPQTQED